MDKDLDRKKGLNGYDTPYIAFNKENPKTITLEGHEVYDYLHPEIISELIHNLCKKFEYADYDAVLVNIKGGKFLYDEIVKIKGLPNRVEEIEYHQPEGGHGAIEVIPVPEDLKGKKCLVVDDILDTGGVFGVILEKLSNDSTCVALVKKRDVKGQIEIENSIIGVLIDDVWVGGCGMNLETEGDGLPEDFLREYAGLVVKILKKLIETQPN